MYIEDNLGLQSQTDPSHNLDLPCSSNVTLSLSFHICEMG